MFSDIVRVTKLFKTSITEMRRRGFMYLLTFFFHCKYIKLSQR